jgi:hypothetical protein
VGGFEPQGGIAVVVKVEVNAETSQPCDVHPRLGAQNPDCFFIAVAGPGFERVRNVGCHSIAGSRLVQHGGDPALGIVGVAVGEGTFG